MTMKSSIWSIITYGSKFFVKPAIVTVVVMYPTTVITTMATVGTAIGCGPTALGVTCVLGFVLL